MAVLCQQLQIITARIASLANVAFRPQGDIRWALHVHKKNPALGRVFGFLVAGAGFGTLPVVFNLAA